ncbi:MAG: glycosyltransferase family 2 protein [Tateyamaria sp.]|uniref:glycosyltransferase n=1 Tax=Tateyamaria sp. TaxID=1929288 RepID=UPI0032951367
MSRPKLAAIAIGRNEGERLVRCLASFQGRVDRLVYVDSGSTDGSVGAAVSAGAEIVELDPSTLFTVSRARNAGFRQLAETGGKPDLIQFVDGDCEIRDGWLEMATDFLVAHPDVAAVSGRRRERYPEATLWNRVIDGEWAAPVGEAKACAGDAMIRTAAFEEVGGFDPDTIVGEEAEMCIRMRRAGWRIWRLDAEMTLHDVAMTKFSQWWRRTRRVGYGYGEAVALYGAPPERHKVSETRRALMWGIALPAMALIGALITPWALLVLLTLPAQMIRLMRMGETRLRATFLILGKLPEALGIIEFWYKHWTSTERRRIDYK